MKECYKGHKLKTNQSPHRTNRKQVVTYENLVLNALSSLYNQELIKMFILDNSVQYLFLSLTFFYLLFLSIKL